MHQIIIAKPQCFTSRSPVTLFKGSLFVVPQTEMVFYQTRLWLSFATDFRHYFLLWQCLCCLLENEWSDDKRCVCCSLVGNSGTQMFTSPSENSHHRMHIIFARYNILKLDKCMLYCMPHKARSALQFPQITVITQQLLVCSNDKSSISGNIRKVKIGRVVIIQTWTEKWNK